MYTVRTYVVWRPNLQEQELLLSTEGCPPYRGNVPWSCAWSDEIHYKQWYRYDGL